MSTLTREVIPDVMLKSHQSIFELRDVYCSNCNNTLDTQEKLGVRFKSNIVKWKYCPFCGDAL